MGTLSGLMWLSRTALAADQQAIDTTASNVANQNTVGYTREVVAFKAQDTVSVGGSVGQSLGVSTKVISQRDRVLEQRLQQQTQSAAQSSARLGALQSAEQVFGISSTSSNASTTAVGSAIDKFFSSFTALSANPTDSATRAAVLAAANTLSSAFNAASQQLSNTSATLNGQITTAANQVNDLTAQIATLNKQITALSPNADAGGLEDQRQEAIKELSALVGVNQITTESNGVTLTTANGAVLVSGSSSFALTPTNVQGKTQLSGGSPPAVLSGVTGGSIGGWLQARDQDLPGLSSSLDQLAYGVATAVNAQNAAGVTSNGAAGGAVFNLPATSAGAAGMISVALTSADGIATAAPGEGAGGTSNAIALAALSTAKNVGGDSASGFFASFIGQLGVTVSSATSDESAQQASLTQAQTQRDALSGVSLDEEASALTQYQRSYEAAAKVFAIVNSIMAAALNLGQQATVS